MVKYRTVIVVGAGASKEANLPDGTELKREISSLLNIQFNGFETKTGDNLVLSSIVTHARKHANGHLEQYFEAAHSIRDAMPQARSIDSYIDHHNGNSYIELCGKLAIVRAILKAESKSRLYVKLDNYKSKPNFEALSDTWFNSFFKILNEHCRAQDLKQRLNTFTLVIFNYDRCFEQFLYYSLINYYKITEEKAAELVNGMEIYHPYGTVGSLPWQKKSPVVRFGEELSAEELLTVSTKILTFTEGTDAKESEIMAIRKKVAESNMFVFLGFAYHKLNLDLLFSQPCKGDYARHCYATAYGFSDSDTQVVSNRLSRLIGKPSAQIKIRNNLKCNEFLQEYSQSLSLD